MTTLAVILENGRHIFVESRRRRRCSLEPEAGAYDQRDDSQDPRKLRHMAILIRLLVL